MSASHGEYPKTSRWWQFAALALGLCSVTPAHSSTRGDSAEGAGDTARTPGAAAQAQSDDATAQRLREALESGEAERVKGALDELASLGPAGRSYAQLVEALLRRGTASGLTLRALDLLAEIGDEGTGAVLLPYTRHRSPEIRRAALRTLGELGGGSAIGALRRALRDRDGRVRDLAALGLASLNAEEALEDLLAAAQRGVQLAALAAGSVCTDRGVPGVVRALQVAQLKPLVPALDRLLFRSEARVSTASTELLLRAIARSHPDAEGYGYLKSVRARWPAEGSATIRELLDQLLERRSSPETTE